MTKGHIKTLWAKLLRVLALDQSKKPMSFWQKICWGIGIIIVTTVIVDSCERIQSSLFVALCSSVSLFGLGIFFGYLAGVAFIISAFNPKI